MVATPIGNLADITVRALHILSQVDGIACEDKRHSSTLLSAYGISKPLYALHEHNEQSASQHIIDQLSAGQRWAYISDAGTPGVSDPGGILTHNVRQAGFRIIPIPGVSALTTAISVSGQMIQMEEGGFHFIGFLPSKTNQRNEVLDAALRSNASTFFYEAPHRIQSTLTYLGDHLSPNQQIFIAKELTKLHEAIHVVTAMGLKELLLQDTNWQGEFVVGIEGLPKPTAVASFDQALMPWVNELMPLISHKDLTDVIVNVTKLPKNEVYQKLLDLKSNL